MIVSDEFLKQCDTEAFLKFNSRILRWPRGTNTWPSQDRWPSQGRWLSQDRWPSWKRRPLRNRGPSQNRCLPKITHLLKFASQDRSLVYMFLIEPRFQINGGKDRKGTIRSQETEEQEDSHIENILTISSSCLDIFLAILYTSDNKISDRFFRIITWISKQLHVNSVTSLFTYSYFNRNEFWLELGNSETFYKAVLIDIYREN